MLDLGRLEARVVRRARVLRGLRAGGAAAAGAAGLALAGAAATRLFALPLRPPHVAAALALLALAALGGFVAAYRPRPDVARLLLAIDLRLGTGERLASLHELRSHASSSPLAQRIEERLDGAPRAWRRAMRIGRRELVPWAAGAAAVALAAWLVALPLPARLAPSPSGAAASGAPSSPASRGSAPAPSPETASPAPSRAGAAPGEVSEPLSVGSLAELLPAPAAQGLLGDLGEVEAAEGRRPGRDSTPSLSEFLSQLLARADLRQTFALTEGERSELENLMQNSADPAVRRALAALGEQTGDALKAQIQETQRLLENQLSGEDGETQAQGERAAESADGEEENENPEATAWVPMPSSSEEGGTNALTRGRPGGADSGGDEGADGRPSAPANEEGGSAAGSEGEGEGAAPPPGAAFLAEELFGSLGATGDLRKYFTKGIPFEPPGAGRAKSASVSLNPEALRALLEARVLAPDVQAVVRAYFASITQGGP